MTDMSPQSCQERSQSVTTDPLHRAAQQDTQGWRQSLGKLVCEHSSADTCPLAFGFPGAVF